MIVESRKPKFLKYILLFGLVVASIAGLFYFFSGEKGPIYDFDPAKDTKPILEIFDKDWYWLVANSREEYSPELMLKHRAHDPKNPSSFGKLTIKVARENGKLAGFAAYYKRRFYEGFFLYLAVAREFRGKKYGEKLARYVLKDLFAKGCNVIRLVTRTDNVKARKLYTKLGFNIYKQEPGFVYFEIKRRLNG